MFAKLALKNVRKSFKDFGIYFVTLILCISLFYAFNSIGDQSKLLYLTETQSSLMELMSRTFQAVSILVAIILAFLMTYANQYLIRRRKREFGLYQLLGMTRFALARIIAWETAMIGLVALAVGIALGLGLSQFLLYVTAMMFDAPVKGVAFFFSTAACVTTCISFVCMFLVMLIWNIVSISSKRLISLIHADRTNDVIRIKNPLFAGMIFVASIGIIGCSYWTLTLHGFIDFVFPEFIIATVLVSLGTFLFFYSISHLAIYVITHHTRSYWMGLNVFTFRQITSKITTASVSLSILSIALFLAITTACTGFATASSINDSLAKGNPYSISISKVYAIETDPDGNTTNVENNPAASDEWVVPDNFAKRVQNIIPQWDTLVQSSAQFDLYLTDIPLSIVNDLTGEEVVPDYLSSSVEVVKESQYNATMKLQGKPEISLSEHEYLMWSTIPSVQEKLRKIPLSGKTFTLDGKTYTPTAKQDGFSTAPSEVSQVGGSLICTLVLPDSNLPSSLNVAASTLNINFVDSSAETNRAFIALLDKNMQEAEDNNVPTDNRALTMYVDKASNVEASMGLSATVSYLAIYLGLVLAIAVAAILAIQQLSFASDSQKRFSVLNKLGCEQRRITTSLAAQIAVYFILPTLVALCHSAVALKLMLEIIQLFGKIDLTYAVISTAAEAGVVLGIYYVITYFLAKPVALSKTR